MPERGQWIEMWNVLPYDQEYEDNPRLGSLALANTGQVGDWKQITWEWDGNKSKPTLKPSIRRIWPDESVSWHRYLTNGVFEDCE